MTDRAVSATELYDQERLVDLTMSPDGTKIGYVEEEFDPVADERRSSVFVAPTDGSKPPFRATRVGDCRSPQWSPTGDRLAFITSRQRDAELCVGSDCVRERGSSAQVWMLDLDRGGDARQLTTVPGGVRSFDWAPDGERVVVCAPDDEVDARSEAHGQSSPVVSDRFDYKTEETGWRRRASCLYVVDVDSRRTRKLPEARGGGASEPSLGLQPSWHPTEDCIAFVTNLGDDAQWSHALGVYRIDADGGRPERLLAPRLKPSNLAWRPDGEELAFVADAPDDPHRPTAAWIIDGERTRQRVADAKRFPTSERASIHWETNRSLLGVVRDGGRTNLARFRSDDGSAEVVWDDSETRSIGQFAYANGRFAVTLSSPSAGIDVFRGTLGPSERTASDLRRLTDANRAFVDEHPMPTFETLRFEQDGHSVEAFVYLPRDFDPDSPDRRPVVVSPHGGPVASDVPQYHFDSVYWTTRGYVVLRVNYRGSSSYGREFSSAIEGEWGSKDVDDVLEAIDRLVERGWADPDRIFGQGFSYGAVLLSFALADSDRFAATVLEHGNYDYRSCYGTSDLGPYLEANFGVPWDAPEAYENVSPMRAVGEVDAPTLVMAGGTDFRAPAGQSEQFYSALKRRGVPTELVVYPSEGHTVSNPDRAVDRLKRISAWFDEHGGT